MAPEDAFPTYLADVLDLDRHARFGPVLVGEVNGSVLAVVTFHPIAAVQGLGWPRDGPAAGASASIRRRAAMAWPAP